MMRNPFGWAAALAVLAPTLARAQPRPGYYDAGHMWADGWHMIFGPLMMIVIIAVIVGAVVFAVRWTGGTDKSSSRSGESAMDILRERFARGEIDAQEFAERRRQLEG